MTGSWQNPVTCETTTTTVWAAARPDGPATTLVTFLSFHSRVVADGGFVYYYAGPCVGAAPATLYRRDLVTGVEVALAQDVDAESPLYVDGSFVYYAPSFGTVARIPK
jgi:hypothetical protein